MITSKIQKLEKYLLWLHIQYGDYIGFLLDRMQKKAQLHTNPIWSSIELSQGEIYYVHLWQNIGNEISKLRPCVIISQKFANNADTVLVAPCTSVLDKMGNKKTKDPRFFIYIQANQENLLLNDSYVSLMQMRSISKRRIDNKLWNLGTYEKNKIIKKLGSLVWIKKNPTQEQDFSNEPSIE
jgi:mRNA-degrading endonuclease toxin of MazEF toxin-antitoxin module